MKVCAKCKIEQPLNQYHKGKAKDGLQSYCRTCNRELNRRSKVKSKGTWYQEDGFATEEEHFNYALRHYAKIFDMPQLLRHQTITGSIKRYYND